MLLILLLHSKAVKKEKLEPSRVAEHRAFCQIGGEVVISSI
jgi:hypothetical protein